MRKLGKANVSSWMKGKGKYHDEAMLPGHNEVQDGMNVRMQQRTEVRRARVSFNPTCISST